MLRIACLLFLLALGACAKNVGNRLSVVVDDHKRFAAKLGISSIADLSILGKASSVSSAAFYSGNHSRMILENGIKAAHELGYTQDRTPASKHRLIYLLCHQNEAGRSLIIETEHGDITVTFSISGWPRDRNECPGL